MQIQGVVGKAHLIYSKLSFSSREMLLREEDFAYGHKIHFAVVLMERVAREQCGEVFANVFEVFHKVADKTSNEMVQLHGAFHKWSM